MPFRMRAYLAWAFICVVWGTTYLAIRICLETVPPLLMGGLRYSMSGVLMIAAMLHGPPAVAACSCVAPAGPSSAP